MHRILKGWLFTSYTYHWTTFSVMALILLPIPRVPTKDFICYFQMSGRAGRRGFDPVGNVIFFGIPYRKVQRLMTANIPKLVGNFPITVSLVLRLLLMTTQADDKEDALTKVSKDYFEWVFFYCFLFFNGQHKIRYDKIPSGSKCASCTRLTPG